MERRGFLKKFSLSFMGLFLGSFNVLGRNDSNSFYQVDFVTHFPYRMSEEKYKEMKSKFQKDHIVNEILKRYKDEGEILSTDYKFTDVKSVWTVLYKSKESFFSYQKEIISKKGRDFNRVDSLGFRSAFEVKPYFEKHFV